MTTSDSNRLHDLLSQERQRENIHWRCPNCRLEISSYITKCSYCFAQIHKEEHLVDCEETESIKRLIKEEHHATGGKVVCKDCKTVLDSHVYKCPECGTPTGGMNTESESNRYQAFMKLPLAILWLLLGILLSIFIWNLF